MTHQQMIDRLTQENDTLMDLVYGQGINAHLTDDQSKLYNARLDVITTLRTLIALETSANRCFEGM